MNGHTLGFCPLNQKLENFVLLKQTYGVGGFGLVTNFLIGRRGFTSFLGEGGGETGGSSTVGGEGGGVGLGDLNKSASSIGSGEGTSRKARRSWSANLDFILSFLVFGLSRSGDLERSYEKQKFAISTK